MMNNIPSINSRENKDEVLQMMEAVLDGMALFGETGEIITINKRALSMFGYEASELIGKNIDVLMPPEVLRQFENGVIEYLLKAKGKAKEGKALRKDGVVFPIDISFNIFMYKGRPGYVSVFRDITERKRLEKLKSEFISSVSHELRTPLTSIHGSLRLIVGGAVGGLPQKASELVNIAANNCDRLVRLINDVLDIEKMAAGMLEIDCKEQFIVDVVSEAVNNNIGFGRRFDVSFHINCEDRGVKVNCDKDRILQVMDNFLSNAAKYSCAGDKVDVNVIDKGEVVRVEVKDHGSGIPDEFKNKVFERFTQADSSDTRKQGGTGLGLSICKSIVKLHHGKLGFESKKGAGCTFWFELSAVQVKVSMGDDNSESAIALICEDDPDVAKLLKMVLKEKGVSSHIAYTAGEADEMLKCGQYKILTLDVNLPDKDGISFLSELRETDYGKDLSVVIVSASDSRDSVKKNIDQLNVNDWVSKPIDDERLCSSIRSAIRPKKTGDKMTVLHIEDDLDIQKLVGQTLGEEFDVITAETVKQAHNRLLERKVDAVILDVGLPDGSGLDVLPFLKSLDDVVPVIVFSAQAVSRNESSQIISVMVKSQDDIEALADRVRSLTQ